MMKVNGTGNFVHMFVLTCLSLCVKLFQSIGTFGSRRMCGETHKKFFSFLVPFFFFFSFFGRSLLFCNDY